MIIAHLSQNTVSSTSPEAFSLYDRSRWGEKQNNRIEYSPTEVIFLVREKKMTVQSKGKNLSETAITQKLTRNDKRLSLKMPVFTDLRRKGYIVKTALKFGTDFRLYNKGVKPGQDHAFSLITIMKESEAIKGPDFAAKNRIAHATRKKLILALVDDESDVTYYETSWIRP